MLAGLVLLRCLPQLALGRAWDAVGTESLPTGGDVEEMLGLPILMLIAEKTSPPTGENQWLCPLVQKQSWCPFLAGGEA